MLAAVVPGWGMATPLALSPRGLPSTCPQGEREQECSASSPEKATPCQISIPPTCTTSLDLIFLEAPSPKAVTLGRGWGWCRAAVDQFGREDTNGQFVTTSVPEHCALAQSPTPSQALPSLKTGSVVWKLEVHF